MVFKDLRYCNASLTVNLGFLPFLLDFGGDSFGTGPVPVLHGLGLVDGLVPFCCVVAPAVTNAFYFSTWHDPDHFGAANGATLGDRIAHFFEGFPGFGRKCRFYKDLIG